MITELLLLIIVFFLIIFSLIGYKVFKLIYNFLPSGVLTDKNSSMPAPGGSILSSWKYKLMVIKAYFDNGYSITSYPKWAFAILGIGSAIKR